MQIACDLSHRIIDLSHVVRGAEADVNLLLQSGLLQQSDEDHRIIGDLGYRGAYGIITPASRKSKKSQELRMLEDEKTQRHELESERAAIEQVNARVKQWSLFKGGYRGDFPDTTWIEPCIRAITALTQLLLQDAPLRKAD